MSTIRPQHDYLLVRSEKESNLSSGGIVIPESATEKSQIGTVIAVGSGRVFASGAHVSLTVKSGDRIIYAKHAGTEVKLNGETYLMMRESEVLAVVDE